MKIFSQINRQFILTKKALIRFFLCFFAGILLNKTYALSPVELKIQQNVLAEQQAAVNFLKTLVNINSGTENIKGVRKVGNILRKKLTALGFKTYWAKEPAFMHKADTLIATRSGTQGKHVLLIGHLDTVFPKKSGFQHFQRKNNLASGPGVVDDKGGLVVMLYALKALSSAKALENTQITVVLTGDEEESGKPTSISRKPLIDAAKNVDVALDFEPQEALDLLSTNRRGISNWTIETYGKEGHSSLIFKKPVGSGAIFELTHILDRIRLQLSGEEYLTFNPGVILGGTKLQFNKAIAEGSAFGRANVIAQRALAEGDLRYLTPTQKDEAKEKMRAIVAQNLDFTSAKITFEDGIPSMPPTKNNLTLLEKYSDVSVDLNYGKVHVSTLGSRGAGDISYVAEKIPANLVGLGAMGYYPHSMKETVEISSLQINAARTALLIYRLTHSSRSI